MPPVAGLRPTPERVRETLFAWLQPRIEGLACLDLFAGTGALGFEAVSRGAARAVLVERDPRLCRGLREQAAAFAAGQRLRIECADALSWLSRPRREAFDLACLDPPFARRELAERCCRLLLSRGLLAEGGLLYLESSRELRLPRPLQTLRCKQAGQVRFLLARLGAAASRERPAAAAVAPAAGAGRAGAGRV